MFPQQGLPIKDACVVFREVKEEKVAMLGMSWDEESGKLRTFQVTSMLPAFCGFKDARALAITLRTL